MAGHVPELARRARAAELLALATSAHRHFAARAVGAERRVLFEQPDPAGGWIGHAEDHVLVRAEAGASSLAGFAGPGFLAGELARVEIVGIDPVDPGRVVGRLLGLVPRPPGTLPGRPIEDAVVRFGPGAGAPAGFLPVQRRSRVSTGCPFCRIVAGEIPAAKVHEDDLIVAIRDLHPMAPVHLLLMPVSY